MKRLFVSFACSILGLLLTAAMASADDWPTYQHDAARSGVTPEELALPLHEQWHYQSRQAPSPAWPPPALQDFWHELSGLRPLVTFDRAYHPVTVGNTVYFGSSSDYRVYALEAATGAVRWSFFTGGPVRLAPTVWDGKVYVGSDDGWVYCLDAGNGALRWKHRPTLEERVVPGNGRMISLLPVRTGVLVDDGVAYYAAGLFPGQAVYQGALDARDGSVLWQKRNEELSPQGYLLASPSRLFVPTGRTTPAMFDRATGAALGALEGQGGAYALLVGDAVVSGPGRSSGQLDVSETETSESFATFDGLRLLVSGDMAYMQSKETISALDRARHTALAKERHGLLKRTNDVNDRLKRLAHKPDAPETQALNAELAQLTQATEELARQMAACFMWKQPSDCSYAFVLAGSTLFAGGDGQVVAFDAANGAVRWTGAVNGKAHGLAAANGRLFVSTDQGTLYCFGAGKTVAPQVVLEETSPNPYPPDEWTGVYAEAAKGFAALAWPGDAPRRGYCLVLDGGDGRLAYALAQCTEAQIVSVEDDPVQAAAAREALHRAGLYGRRVAVYEGPSANLPFGNYCANLVVSAQTLGDGSLPGPAESVCRLLRPYGGTACFVSRLLAQEEAERWLNEAPLEDKAVSEDAQGVWMVARRGVLPGSGEWTQLYADAHHTAASTDTLEGPTTLQWFGEPGPRQIIDRHHRPMSPLFKAGRLFVNANNRVIAMDAYNGATIWELDVPHSRRIGALKNCGHLLVTEDSLYVAAESTCWTVDVVTGKPVRILEAPQLADAPKDWGYLNREGQLLVGSGQQKDSSFSALRHETCSILEGDFRLVIASDYLFAMDRHSGAIQWTYQDGLVMNNAITLGEGRLYFAESRNDYARKDRKRNRIRIDKFCASDTYLVALDTATGNKLWEQPIELPYQHIMYLNFAEDTLLFCGTYNEGPRVFYGLQAHDAQAGRKRWDTAYRALDIRGHKPADTEGSHGEQWQHPVLISGTIYSRPFAFDLHTGEKKDFIAYRGGHGCGGWTGSAHYLYGRGSNPRIYPLDMPSTEGIPLTKVSRPGCWLNIIPAGGLVLIPESSSGCTCAYPVQTSLALVPKDKAGPLIN